LKAIAHDPLMRGLSEIIAYWRETGDVGAAGIIVKHAEEGVLEQILPELISRCDEGWVISRAALRVRLRIASVAESA
jgi:hypothetical protein